VSGDELCVAKRLLEHSKLHLQMMLCDCVSTSSIGDESLRTL
jgi:hypothetical protein